LTTNPEITAWRLLACSLGDDDVKTDHLALILSQLNRRALMTDTLIQLADIAANLARSRYGDAAHGRCLSSIASLLDQPDQHTPVREGKAYRDRPNRRNSN